MHDFTADFKRGARTVLERFVEGFDNEEWQYVVLDPAWYAPSQPRTVYKRLHAEAKRQGLPVYVDKKGPLVRLSHQIVSPDGW